MIEVRGLVKRYGRLHAVDGVDLTARPGEVLALLGPNGAGKSTTIKAITGLIRPSAGHVLVAGVDVSRSPVAAKAALGYVPDRPYLYPKLTGRELLRFLGRLRRVDDVEAAADAWLDRFGLQDVQNERIEAYSHGMRQKLTFCAALLHDPPVVVIDEPMVGLDPRAAREVRRLMRERADAGRTVLLTTHQIDVAEETADRVTLLHRGQVAAEGTVSELRRRVGREDARLEAVFLALTEDAAARDVAAPS
ncbi:MAG: ATP-binding cassette domain-containing protein [Deinococcus-Thermus bacterium]|nr:ATP-binding cassette domain-containing protein [Deinococcota bacterium]